MFQFYAGDLYEAIPKMTNDFYANEVVSGNCTTSPSDLLIEKDTHTTINITLAYECFLSAKNHSISHFIVHLTSSVEGKPHHNEINFHIVGFEKKVDFLPIGGYEVQNVELAELMI